MKQGTLTYEYLLSRKEGIRKSLYHNETLTGAALQGKVIDIAKDTVRIHLDIDPEQKKDEAIWFPYSTVYSAEGHTGFYSMPQLGDTVQLYFPNRNEANAITMSSNRQGGETNPKTADPSTKLWGTPNGKEMKMNGNEVSFTAKEGEVHLKLDIKEGIEFQSKPPIAFQAGNIEIHAGNSMEMKATNAIHLLCASSSIVMDGITDIQGSIVSMEGYNKAPVQIKDSNQEEGNKQEQSDKFTDPSGPAQNLAGLIPIIGGGLIG